MSVQYSVHGQDCIAADRLRVGNCRMAEEQLTAEEKDGRESHAAERDRAAGVHTVGIGVAAMQIGVGGRGILVEADETAAANIAASRSLVEVADNPVSVGLAVVDFVGFVDTVAQNDLAVVADNFDWAIVVGIAAQTERLMLADTAEWAENAEIVDTAVSGVVGCTDTAVLGIVGCADTADAAGSVGLLHWFGLDSIVEVVDIAEAAGGTADTVAATEWRPCSTTMTQYLDSRASRKMGSGLRS